MKSAPLAGLATLALLTNALHAQPGPSPTTPRVVVRETLGRTRGAVLPCPVSFPRGEVREPSRTRRLAIQGIAPQQTWRVLTRWPDGTAREALATAAIAIGAHQTLAFDVEAAEPPPPPAAFVLDLDVRRLLPKSDQEPWFEIVSEVEDYEGTIHRARLEPDPAWRHAVREPLVEQRRFRSHHRAFGSRLGRDLLSFTAWLELRARDPHFTLEVALGNDYPGAFAARPAPEGARAETHPDHFPLGGPIHVRRWSLRMRGLTAAVAWSDWIGTGRPTTHLGWTQIDLLPPTDGGLHALADGQRVVRRLLVAPVPTQASETDRAGLEERLREELAHPLRARATLATRRASGSFGLLGTLGPPSQSGDVLAKVAAARVRRRVQGARPLDPLGFAGFGPLGAQPLAPSADLILDAQGGVEVFQAILAGVFQGLAAHPWHVHDLDAFRHPTFLGGTLPLRVDSTTYGAWKTPADRTRPEPPTPASRRVEARPDDALAAYLATRSPFLRDELALMLHHAIAIARPAHPMEPALEAQALHAAVLLDRLERDPRVLPYLETRMRQVVLPALRDGLAAQTPHVHEHPPRADAFGSRVTWGSSTQAAHLLTACLEAYEASGSTVFLEVAHGAARFLVACWFDGDGLRGLARRLPLRRRGGPPETIARAEILGGGHTVPGTLDGRSVEIPWSTRLEVSLDEEAALAAAPLARLADLLESSDPQALPPSLDRSHPFVRRLRTIAHVLGRSAPQDDLASGWLIGTSPPYQALRDAETRDRLDLEVLANPRGTRDG